MHEGQCANTSGAGFVEIVSITAVSASQSLWLQRILKEPRCSAALKSKVFSYLVPPVDCVDLLGAVVISALAGDMVVEFSANSKSVIFHTF